MTNEKCWVLLGENKDDLWYGRMQRMTEGRPASVEFDPYYVLEHADQVVGFFHTHPGMTSHYSSIDDRTMKAWCLALGKPLACCIRGIDGLRAWWFLDDEQPPEVYQAKRLGKLIFGVTPDLYEGPVHV